MYGLDLPFLCRPEYKVVEGGIIHTLFSKCNRDRMREKGPTEPMDGANDEWPDKSKSKGKSKSERVCM